MPSGEYDARRRKIANATTGDVSLATAAGCWPSAGPAWIVSNCRTARHGHANLLRASGLFGIDFEHFEIRPDRLAEFAAFTDSPRRSAALKMAHAGPALGQQPAPFAKRTSPVWQLGNLRRRASYSRSASASPRPD